MVLFIGYHISGKYLTILHYTVTNSEMCEQRAYSVALPGLTLYTRRRQPTARVPSVARGTIFNGTLSELKYSNYDPITN
jgi:hypothetical protein